MYKLLAQKLQQFAATEAPATGIGLFRLLYGLVTFQEILFLLYFKHLIFDPIPYIDVEFPMIGFFLALWAIAAFCLSIGYRCQDSAIISYLFWILFVQFTPMQRDFDGGFDVFMTGAGFFLIFMPIDKAFSLDNLRRKLLNPFTHYSQYPPQTVSILAYYIPITICLSFLYFDSAIHKMFAPHWRNGLGSWLPATQPYYVSAINMSALLNNELFVKSVGYIILVFQFTYIFFVQNRYLRPFYLFVGMGLHLGIILTLNIYPFGFGMLIFYVLLIPFAWWRYLAKLFEAKQPTLTIFYDEQCPLCNRTALTLNHFDLFKCLDFRSAQKHREQYPALKHLSEQELLVDLFTLDTQSNINSGVKAYSQILISMRYPFIAGLLLKTPLIYTYACRVYRKIADNRLRVPCDASCLIPIQHHSNLSAYDRLVSRFNDHPKRFSRTLAKLSIIILILQLNSTINYGFIYRFKVDTHQNSLSTIVTEISNSTILLSQMLLGITPHALYLHDHFAGYDHIIALTYNDQQGNEQWLPFVNSQGRLLSPNWGRVHSMWANIAVTPNINNTRLSKFIMKVTAFLGRDIGLDINQTTFNIKLKKIQAPSVWVHDQLNQNLTGEWQTIGSATWKNNVFSISLPKNINDL